MFSSASHSFHLLEDVSFFGCLDLMEDIIIEVTYFFLEIFHQRMIADAF